MTANKRADKHIFAFGELKTIDEWLLDHRCACKTRNQLLTRLRKMEADPNAWDGDDVVGRELRPRRTAQELQFWESLGVKVRRDK
jgi:hypothetical protein